MASLRSCCRSNAARILFQRCRSHRKGDEAVFWDRGAPILAESSAAEAPLMTLHRFSRPCRGLVRSFATQATTDNSPSGDSTAKPASYGFDMYTTMDPSQSRYVFVPHGEAYERSLEGLHGQTLEKAKYIGNGKDDEPFDPFLHDEQLEQSLLQEEADQEAAKKALERGDDEDDEPQEEGDSTATDVDEDDEELGEFDEDAGDEDLLTKKGDLTDEEMACVMYNADGSIRRKASQKAILKAGAPAGGIFAIVALAGSQYKVTTDDLLIVNRLDVEQFKVGSIHPLKDILMVGTTHFTLVGLPYVPNAAVHVMVEEITRDKKVIIFKKRRRKNSQRRNGFRRDVTMLRILDITMPEVYEDLDHRPRIEPDLLPPRRNPRNRRYEGGVYKYDDEEEEDDYDEDEDMEDEEPQQRATDAA